MSLKAIAEQELARMKAGEVTHETERETELKQMKRPVSCFIDASDRFMPLKHDKDQKYDNSGPCFTVSLPSEETHETSLPDDVVAGVQRLRTMRPPRLLTPGLWPRVISDAIDLVDTGWASKALALGWSPLDLFGAVSHTGRSGAGHGAAGRTQGHRRSGRSRTSDHRTGREGNETMNIVKRVGALEGRDDGGRFDRVHRILCKDGQTGDGAKDAYGQDKIGSRDLVIIRSKIAPHFDAAGNMIHFKDWPENRASADVSATSV